VHEGCVFKHKDELQAVVGCRRCLTQFSSQFMRSMTRTLH
jgi:hypothetical protein